MQGSMQRPDYSAKTICHERNNLVLFILSIMHGGYNINIRCNQKFIFCKDRGMDLSVNCTGDTRDMRVKHFWGLPLSYPQVTTMGIPTLPPGGQTKVVFQRFNRLQKLNFRCMRDKKLDALF